MSKRYLDAIYNFITSESERALMINGNWGSGKTYFVKNKLIPHLKVKKISSIYVSLYGHNNLESITSSIYNNILMEKSGIMYQIIPYAEKTITLLGNLNKGVKALTDVFPINRKSLKNVLSDASKYLLIFDDLERSNIDYEEILGYINNICEHSGNKVIIVANENEITRVSDNLELPMRYQTALLAKDYNYEKQKNIFESFNNNSKNDDSSKVQNLDDLKTKTSSIFDSDTRYDIIKEKTIEKTITFEPNIYEVFDSLLNNAAIFENDILQSKKREIIRIFNNHHHNNIRTIQTFIGTFKKFSHLISLHQVSDIKQNEEFISVILNCIASSTIRYKTGYEKSKWVTGSEFGMVDFGRDTFTPHFYSFKFIEEYIWDSDFDEIEVRKTLNSFLSKQTLSREDAIHKLNYYWQMEDSDVVSSIKEIIDGLVNSKYPTASFNLIILLFLKLNEIGFEIDMENIATLMENSNNFNDASLESFMNYEISISDESKEIYNNLIDRVNKKQVINIRVNYSDKILEILNNQNWSAKLYDFYLAERSYFYDNKGFICYVDMDSLIFNLDNASNYEFSDFRRTLGSIYDRSRLNENFAKDYDNLVLLNQHLKSQQYTSKIKKMSSISLQELIGSVIFRLEESISKENIV